ncbi:hypothetical protein ACE5IS_09125 [Leptospira wolffii]|uniref:DUF5683 domain-containing protein n=1 Tax=Leptospira wolffii TaxID=409998 RepID=A0ABV5BNJ3_9LEPT
MTQRLTASLLLLLFSLTPVFSDNVTLKSGHEYRNVKTVLGKSTVNISTEDGKNFSIPVGEIKFIKSAPVKWDKSQEEEVKPLPGPFDPNASLPVSAVYPKKRPDFSLMPLTGFVPVWSPSYLMDSSLGTPIGIFFSVTEFAALGALISQSSNSPKAYYSDTGNLVTTMYLLFPNQDFTQSPTFASLYYMKQNMNLVKGINGHYVTKEQYREETERLASGLVILLVADVIINFVLPDFLWRRKPVPRDFNSLGAPTEGWRMTIKNQVRPDGEMLYHFGLTNHF